MQLVYGLGLIGGGVLLIVAGLRIVRRQEVPRWLEQGAIGDLVTVAVIGMLTLGLGLLIEFAVQFREQTFGLREASALVALVAVFAVAAWRLRILRPERRAEAAAQGPPDAAPSAAVVPLAPGDGGPAGGIGPEGRPAGGRGGGKRKAA